MIPDKQLASDIQSESIRVQPPAEGVVEGPLHERGGGGQRRNLPSKKNVHQNRSKEKLFNGVPPPGLEAFRWNPPSQLFIGYHWLAFLNQVRNHSKTVVQVSNSLGILSTYSAISQN